MVALRALACAGGAIALWSTNAVVAKRALTGLGVEQVQFLQFASAALAFVVIRRWDVDPDFGRKTPTFWAFLLGVVGLTGTMVFQYLAFANAPITQANIVAYGWPLLAAAWVASSYRHSVRAFSLMAAALAGFVGVALVIGEGRGLTFEGAHGFGSVCALLSALCMATYTVGIAKTGTPSSQLLLPATLVGVALTALWCGYESRPWPDLMYIFLGCYLGAGPMAAGYVLWSLAVRFDDAGRIAVLGYLTPICSTALLLLSGERLTGPAAMGAVLVLLSCFFLGVQRKSATP
jgi:drug/metabolite transporter (DMT)-like permease